MENFNNMNDDDFLNYTKTCNVWKVGKDIRIKIAKYLKDKFFIRSIENRDLINKYNQLMNQKKELENIFDMEIIRNEKVVGMTTTGCSKYSTILEQMNFEIIIVEEAAEVLGSPIASILTRSTQHLIMIGDHQQLRPNPFNHKIATEFKFNISMFERLINNGVPKVSLGFQRRMRPEFVDFVRLIYNTSYIDHESTLNKSNVKGFLSNIFFLNHKNYEETNINLASKKNEFEAMYIYWLGMLFSRDLV